MTQIDSGFALSCLEYAEIVFACSDGPADSTDALDQPYKIVVSGGPRVEGEGLPALFDTPQAAARAWAETLCHEGLIFRTQHEVHALQKVRLFWRTKPEMNEVVRYSGLIPREESGYDLVDVERWYTVYSRLSFAPPEVR